MRPKLLVSGLTLIALPVAGLLASLAYPPLLGFYASSTVLLAFACAGLGIVLTVVGLVRAPRQATGAT